MRENTSVQAWWPRVGAVAAGICLMAAAGCQGSISKGNSGGGTGNGSGGAGNNGTGGNDPVHRDARRWRRSASSG